MRGIIKKSNWLDILIALLGTAGICAVITFRFGYYYEMNDDVLMKDIMSGIYSGTPSGYNIQMLFPLSYLISRLYRLAPQYPWYDFFLCGCIYLCSFLVSKRLVEVTHKGWKKILYLAAGQFLIMTVFLRETIIVQYTVVAGMLMATAAYWFYTTDHTMEPKRFVRHNLISVVLILLAFTIRSEMALLLLPLFCLVGLFRWIDAARAITKREKVIDGKRRRRFYRVFAEENRKKYLTLVIIVAMGMFITLVVNSFAYGTREWSRFTKLFNSRTEIYDFLGIPAYDGHEEIYETAGLSREEQGLLENYNYLLDDAIDQETFERLETVISDGGHEFFTVPVTEGLKQYLYRLTHKQDAPYIYYVWLGYFLMFVSAVMLKKRTYYWKLPVMFAGRSALWMYLILRGRTPERVTHPLYVMELAILMAMILSEIKRFKSDDAALYRRFWPMTVMLTLLLAGGGAFFRQFDTVEEELANRDMKNLEWQAFETYCAGNPENFYILDVYSTVAYSERMYSGKENALDNYTLAGGWACKSPLEQEKLSHYGIVSVEKELPEREDVLFVAYADQDISWLEKYYRSKGTSVRAVRREIVRTGGEKDFAIYDLKQNDWKRMERRALWNGKRFCLPTEWQYEDRS